VILVTTSKVKAGIASPKQKELAACEVAGD
jgi:hypothetical protein